jgi:putative NADH-flavin reductase
MHSHLLIEDLRKSPGAERFIAVAENHLKELRFLQGVDDANWVGVSPSQNFVPGDATAFVLGEDELLVAPDGSSQVTTGTMAVAIMDEVEHPVHIRERFTVRGD